MHDNLLRKSYICHKYNKYLPVSQLLTIGEQRFLQTINTVPGNKLRSLWALCISVRLNDAYIRGHPIDEQAWSDFTLSSEWFNNITIDRLSSSVRKSAEVPRRLDRWWEPGSRRCGALYFISAGMACSQWQWLHGVETIFKLRVRNHQFNR